MWLLSVPRRKTDVAWPGVPFRATTRPGTLASASASVVNFCSSMAVRVITETLAAVFSTGSSVRVAVTTKVGKITGALILPSCATAVAEIMARSEQRIALGMSRPLNIEH